MRKILNLLLERKMPLDLEQDKTPIEQWHDAIVIGMKMNVEQENAFRTACALYDAEKEQATNEK